MSIDFAHFDGNTSGNVDVHLRRALAEGGGSKVVFGVKSQSFFTFGRTLHRRRMCGFSFLNVSPKTYVFLFVFIFYHRVSDSLMKVLSRGMWP